VIRDGVDPRPLRSCREWCGHCANSCHLAERDAALRGDGWAPIEDVVPGTWVEVMTEAGRAALARYLARGDYLDRWISAAGARVHNVTHWRPYRPRLLPALSA
jgi:hypothetical protein